MLTVIALILAFIFLPSPWNVIVVVVTALVDTLETTAFVWWSRRRRRTSRAAVGVESIVGRSGVALGRLGAAPMTAGQVRVNGEIWNARSSAAVDPGTEVRIVAVEGLTLAVEPVVVATEADEGSGS